MTDKERALFDRALALLRVLGEEPDNEIPIPPRAPVATEARPCPITAFAKTNIVDDPDGDVTCEELWMSYEIVAATGTLPALSKSIFLRELPMVMEEMFGARKAHNIIRGASRQRGFRHVSHKPLLREFEWVVGQAFVTQAGLVNLHGPSAALFLDGERVNFVSKDTGRTFTTTVKSCGVLLSGPGSRTAAGFKGVATKTNPVPNVDRLVFKELKRGTFEVVVRRVDPAVAATVKRLHKQYKKNKNRIQHRLVEFGVIKAITN